MYNAGKIIIGLIIFLGSDHCSRSGTTSGRAATPPKLEVGTQEKQCVESTPYMKSSHMQLLDTWRDEVVRNGKRVYINSTGKTFDMSLQNTCTKCHAKKDAILRSMPHLRGRSPKCWDCHIAPDRARRLRRNRPQGVITDG